jgi:alpha-beta hydrolase superfamily lysophospholipase
VLLGLPLAFSQVMIGTQRQPTHPAPGRFEELQLASEGLRLRAWLLRGDPQRAAAVIVHGVGDSLESWTEVADTLHRRGHTALLLDLRGHGGSEGRHMTLGGREREDVRAAISHLQQQGLAPQGLLLMGWSMGAVAVLRAAAERSDVRAVVAEAPFDTYRNSVAHHARLLYGLPRWVPLIPLSIAMAEWRAGFRADDVDAVAAARKIRAPLLAVADGADPRMPETVVRRVFDAHPGPKRFWLAPGVDHVGAILLPDYWKTVTAFLAENGV